MSKCVSKTEIESSGKKRAKGKKKKVQSEKTALLIIQKYSGSNRISASNENGISNKVMIFMKSGVVSG